MRIEFAQPAEAGTVFATHAFESQIGKVIPMQLPGGRVNVRVVGAKVANEGRCVHLTLELPEG